jgi:hypothetical protein
MLKCINGLLLEVLFTSVTESFVRYTSFSVPFQCDSDLLFYWLPSNMTSSHNIDFHGFYNTTDVEERKDYRLMSGPWRSKQWL